MADSLRYDVQVNLSDKNNSHSLLVLLTGRDKKVLEVGPATGYVTQALTARGCRVSCIEIDPEAAELARPHCERMIVGNVEDIDFDEAFVDEKFDVVIYGDVLEHLLDPADVLRKTARILAPGGYVAASVPNVAHGSIRLALLRGDFNYTEVGLLDRTHLRFFTRETLAALFEEAGYTVKTWRRTTFPPFGTEQRLKQEDWPAYLVESLRDDPEAQTYQFVVRAEPRAGPGENGAGPRRRRRPHDAVAFTSLRQVQQEYQARETLLREQETRLQQAATELEEKTRRVTALETELTGAYTHIHNLNQHINAITGSIGWRLLKVPRAVIRFLMPPGSPQGVPFRLARRAYQYGRRNGFRTLLARGLRVWEWPGLLGEMSRMPLVHLPLNDQYAIWLKRNSITPKRAREMQERAQAFAYRPKVSIIVPVYNPDPSWLRDAIDSVRAQLYEDWELCLADDCSTREGIREIMQEYAVSDTRIKITFCEVNGGISAASNAALALATGEFIGLLDHDDEITPDALFEIVNLLNEQPDLDYIYSDEDKKDPSGRRIDPFFKPDWSPDLLLSLNYVTHFSIYRKSLVDRLGGFRLGFEGSQDYDLVLRVSEQTDRIAHLPKQLYSWRMVPGSAASSPEAKNFAYETAKLAIQAHLDRRGINAEVEDAPRRKGYYRVRYAITGAPRVAIVIPTRDKLGMLRRCIDSIKGKSTYDNYEIIIINNQSSDPATLEYFKTFGGRVVDYPHEFNYSQQMNLGVDQAGCEYVILMNNDTEVITPDWIEAMLEHAQRPEVGAVGSRLLFPGGGVQHEGVFIGCGRGLAGHIDHRGYFALGECIRDASAVTAACMMVKAPLYREVGGLDSDLRVAYNDVDFCLKLRHRGYLIIYTPYAELYHEEGGTRGHIHPQQNADLFRTRWRNFRDPYYNINFDLDHPFNLKL